MLTKPCPDCLNGKAMERWGWRCFECHTKVRDTQLARNRHNTNGEQGGGLRSHSDLRRPLWSPKGNK